MGSKQAWVIKIAIFSLFVLLSQWNFSFAQSSRDLNWEFNYRLGSNEGLIKFLNAQLVENKLKFDIMAHNTSKKHYQCLEITAGNETVHIDDEMGAYPGIRVLFLKEADNKFALNQRKKISLYIPRPSSEADVVNIHFGFFFRVIGSNRKCREPLNDRGEYNFHMTDWNISFIRK